MVNLAAVDKRQLSQGLQHLVSRAEKKHNMDYNPASPWSPLFCESSKPSLWVPFFSFWAICLQQEEAARFPLLLTSHVLSRAAATSFLACLAV